MRDFDGNLIAIEGIDGAGTTTQTRYFDNVEGVVTTKEPQDGYLDEMITEAKRSDHMSPEQVAILFAADRVKHCESPIFDARGSSTVVTDRYYLSSLAYQVATGVETSWVESINKYRYEADITFLLDIPIDAAMKRLSDRWVNDPYENKEFLEDVRDNYLEAADGDDSIIVLDATEEPNDIHEEIWAAMRNRGML